MRDLKNQHALANALMVIAGERQPSDNLLSLTVDAATAGTVQAAHASHDSHHSSHGSHGSHASHHSGR